MENKDEKNRLRAERKAAEKQRRAEKFNAKQEVQQTKPKEGDDGEEKKGKEEISFETGVC
jgi:hypothetical protein